jgi:hypothetical protein
LVQLDRPSTLAVAWQVGSGFKPVIVYFFGTDLAALPLPPGTLQSSLRKPALKPRASQRCRVKRTAGIYALRYEAPPIFCWGGTGQANGILSVKHLSTRTRGVQLSPVLKPPCMPDMHTCLTPPVLPVAKKWATKPQKSQDPLGLLLVSNNPFLKIFPP